VLLLIFAGALAWFGRSLHLTLDLRDEGYLFYEIERVARGEVPHRDFRSVYGPLVYAANAPVYRASGGEILAVRRQLAVLRALAVVPSTRSRQLVGRPTPGPRCSRRPIDGALEPEHAVRGPLHRSDRPVAPLARAADWLAGGRAALLRGGPGQRSGVLFKQSLGLACAYGLGWRWPRPGCCRILRARPRGRAILCLWGRGVAIAAPFAAGLRARLRDPLPAAARCSP
jgi:hypothetical protein